MNQNHIPDNDCNKAPPATAGLFVPELLLLQHCVLELKGITA